MTIIYDTVSNFSSHLDGKFALSNNTRLSIKVAAITGPHRLPRSFTCEVSGSNEIITILVRKRSTPFLVKPKKSLPFCNDSKKWIPHTTLPHHLNKEVAAITKWKFNQSQISLEHSKMPKMHANWHARKFYASKCLVIDIKCQNFGRFLFTFTHTYHPMQNPINKWYRQIVTNVGDRNIRSKHNPLPRIQA